MKRLKAIDPASCSGVADFDELGGLERRMFVKPRGGKGQYYAGDSIHESRIAAWRHVYAISPAQVVVIERGFGAMMNAVRSQGIQIGWHQCMCANYGVPIIEVNVSEWRRVISEDQSISWPKDSDRCKALSVQLVERIYGITVTADESDAILLGLAAIRMGMAY